MAVAELEPRQTVKTGPVAPFTIEIDGHNNNDVMLQSIPGCRMRSAISATRYVTDYKTGQPVISIDSAIHLGQLPPTPGMQITVYPDKCSYTIIDPMHTDEDLCDRLQSAINRSTNMRIDGKLRGVPPQKGTLDVDRMKTLCREMLCVLGSNDAKVVKGVAPSIEDVDKLPGNYLLNPGSTIPNTQPRYEKDMAAWVQQLNRTGG